MGSVFKKAITKSLPANAETFVRKGQRMARWVDSKGRKRAAPLTATGERIRIEANCWYARFRDHDRNVVERPTGCKDKQAAEQLLAQWEREADRIRAGVVTPTEKRMVEQQALPIEDHIAAYEGHLRAKGATATHVADTGRYLRRLAADCGFASLAGLNREALESWLAAHAGGSMSARTRNAYRNAAVAFGNWCTDPQVGRLSANPFARAPKANEKADPRRQRRALAEDELRTLLAVARARPLEDAMTVHRGKRKGEAYAKLRPDTRQRLEALGRERALIYKTLVLTGLRKAELASLTVRQLTLEAGAAFAVLDAADEKNREGNTILLREDLAADLRAWLAHKLAQLQGDARRQGKPIPVRLAPDTPWFDVPAGLVKILDRDLVRAGIARRVKGEDGKVRIDKRDERGRTIDVHALRTTFGTLMSRAGVAPRTAQAAMRHGDIRLTMGVYTDPRLLDVRGAVDALPALPLGGAEEMPQKATGTVGEFARQFAAPQCKLGQTLTIEDNNSSIGLRMADFREFDATSMPVKAKGPLTIAVSGPSVSGRLDSNQRPPEPHSGREPSQPVLDTPDASPAISVCTPVCTTYQKTANEDGLEALATALSRLTPEDRAKLAAMLGNGGHS